MSCPAMSEDAKRTLVAEALLEAEILSAQAKIACEGVAAYLENVKKTYVEKAVR